MKKFAPLLLTTLLAATPLLADPFSDADNAFSKAFDQQDQTWDNEVKNQDAAYAAYVDEMDRAWKKYAAEIDNAWGKSNAKKPSKKEWVAYSKDRDQRSSIDFEKGELQVDILLNHGESPESKQVAERIQHEITKVIKQPAQEDKALQVTLPANAATSTTSIYPLKGQLKRHNGETVTNSNAAKFAAEVVKRKPLKRQTIQTPQGEKVMLSVSIHLVPNHLQKRTKPYLKRVHEMAQRYHIPDSLILGIMQTESYFNPMAHSGVPAFGLMQLVPRSGARDAYQYVYKNDKIVSSNYLYNAQNNIELGSAYLKLLQRREMRRITNPQSRMICAIAAYNTGGGNVAKAFIPGSRNIRRASKIINTMSFEQVYQHLRTHLPYEETQNYVQRVRKHMKNFTKLDSIASLE
ncbi:MAG: murein transglycosylase domain-containing protein [Mariprofundus sp.]|nr:murein transglycosylase domain-containing protein [Mariprofundus sp.]